MEGVRERSSKASNKYGAKERSFGSRTKYLFTYLDRDQCTEILESCYNEIKNADRWNLEGEEGGGVGDGELEGTRTFGIQPATVHVGDVSPAVSTDNTSNPPINSAPQPTGSQSAPTVPAYNQNQQSATLDERLDGNTRSREWLGALKTTFKVVEGASGMTPVVGTYVGSAAKVGTTLVEMIQGMGSNEEAAKDLESRVLELSNILKHFDDESVEKRKDDLTKYINDLQRELQYVQREVERLNSSGILKKVFASSDRVETLNGYQETIRTALEQIQELYDKEAAKEQRRLLNLLGDAYYGARGDTIEDVTCLEGTRVQILSRIDDWIRDASTSERALWLRGMAGRGKSTIASTVAHRWTDRAVCAIFHFRRGQNTLDKRLVCALARQLCSNGLVPELREPILKTVEENEAIVQDRLQGQFKALFVDPLARFRRNPAPIILIVDALDECEDVNYAVKFVELIDQNSSRFPANVKFLLTSRPEAPLIRALEPRQWYAENLDSEADVAGDVERYLVDGLSKLRTGEQTLGNWPRPEDVTTLVAKSQGLFQWAYTVMEYIRQGSPEDRLEWLLTSPDMYDGLDSLYLQIFAQALNKAKKSPVGEQSLLYVLSTLVAAPHPISLDIFAFLSADLSSFRGKHHDTIVKLLRSEVLINLGSVIHVPDSPGDSIRLMHTSVRDLLVDAERCGGEPYSVDVASSHKYLALKCLQLMRQDLKRNICHLSDPSKANSDIDIQALVELHVPKGLQYCCRSWSRHLMAGTMGPPPDGQQILVDIGGFSAEKVLEWLEVMCLIGETRESMKIAKQMHSWLQECPHAVEPSLVALWSDMHRFIITFYELIAFGALHIYASFLSSPLNTSFWKHNSQFATIHMLNGPRETIWPASVWSRQTNAGVTSIAFSPYNGVIVSGFSDGVLQFWDAEFGAHFCDVFQGTHSMIGKVALRRPRIGATGCNEDIVRRFQREADTWGKLQHRHILESLGTFQRDEHFYFCCFACLEGLLPEPENTAVLRFIYILCLWHGLAKCRQHTDVTLKLLEVVTERLGDELRAFESYTATFDTYETPKEASARDRRAAASARKGKLASRGSNNDKSGRRKKRFSLRTVKVHLLGHYVPTIRRFGTTDSYSTQVGELEHRTVKGFYRRTNKQDFVKQTTRLCRRQERIQKITENVRKLGIDVGKKMKIIDRSKSIPLPPTQPALQYQIAETSKHWIHLGHLVRENPDEPALRSFITNLKNHVIGRLRNRPFDGEETDFGAEECDNLVIKDNIIHQHAYLRINYTTYDVRRDQDIINPRIPSRSFVMVPAAAGDHPYWYARVLGIYDLSVSPSRQDPAPVKLQFLWVRWLGEDPNHIGDFDSASLYRVGYVRFSSGSEAFGFLDPSIVIRGCHLIPAFRFGFTKDLLPASDFYDDPEAGDFVNYYVNQFVDRDMLMRFIGCGVGHAGMVDATYAPGAVQQILNIASTSKTDETLEAIRLLPEGRRQLAGDEEVLLESDGDEGGSNSEAAGSDRDSEMDVDDDDGDAASLEDYEY